MKYVSREKTRKVNEPLTVLGGPSNGYQYYAYYYKCIKYGKEEIMERRRLIQKKQEDVMERDVLEELIYDTNKATKAIRKLMFTSSSKLSYSSLDDTFYSASKIIENELTNFGTAMEKASISEIGLFISRFLDKYSTEDTDFLGKTMNRMSKKTQEEITDKLREFIKVNEGDFSAVVDLIGHKGE